MGAGVGEWGLVWGRVLHNNYGLEKYVPPDRLWVGGSQSLNGVLFLPLLALRSCCDPGIVYLNLL